MPSLYTQLAKGWVILHHYQIFEKISYIVSQKLNLSVSNFVHCKVCVHIVGFVFDTSMTPMHRQWQITYTWDGWCGHVSTVDNIHLRRLVWTCEHCGYPAPPEMYCVSQSPPDNAHRLHHQVDSGGRGEEGGGRGTKTCLWVVHTCTQHLTRGFWWTRVRVGGGQNQRYIDRYTHMYVSVFNHNIMYGEYYFVSRRAGGRTTLIKWSSILTSEQHSI